MTVKEMRAKRAQFIDKKDSIIDKAMNETRGLSEGEKEELVSIKAQIEKLSSDIKATEDAEIKNVSFLEGGFNPETRALDEAMVNYVRTGKVPAELRAANVWPGAGKMNTQTTSTMDVIIPTHLSDFILDRMYENSNAFAEAAKFETVGGKFQLTREKSLETAAVIIAEGEEFDGFSMLEFEQSTLDQMRFVAGYVLTQHLLNNANYNLVSYCLTKMARKMARKLENEIFNGSASGDTPVTTGFRGLGAHEKLGKVTVANAAAVNMDTFVNLINEILPQFLDGSKFYMGRDLYNKICLMKDAQGHYYVQNGVVNGKLVRTLFGYEIVVTEMLTSKTASKLRKNACFFGNMSMAYAIGMKKGMELKHIYADTQNAIQGTHTLLLDLYADGCIYDEQAMVKLEVTDGDTATIS